MSATVPSSNGPSSPLMDPPISLPRTNTSAMWAVVMAIFLPAIGAIPALLLAGEASRQIRASGGAQTGMGLVWIARCLAILEIVVFSLLMFLDFAGF